MKNIAIILITLWSTALITTTAFAGPCGTSDSGHQGQYMHSPHHSGAAKHPGGYHGMKKGHGFHGKPFHGKQKSCWQQLSQKQKEQLKALHQQFIDETVSNRTAIANLYNELQMLMETSAPDRDKLVSLIKKMQPLKTEMAIKRIDLQLKTKKIAPELPAVFFMAKRGHSQKQHRCFPEWNENSPCQTDASKATE